MALKLGIDGLRFPYDWNDCPFLHEVGRDKDDRKPCPERYRPECGCKFNRVPSQKQRWKRTNL